MSRLVVAPITAPAAAPIAASRSVFFLIVVRAGAGAEVLVPELDEPDDPDELRVLDVRRGVVRAGAAGVWTTGAGAATSALRSAGESESNGTAAAPIESALSTGVVSVLEHATTADNASNDTSDVRFIKPFLS